MHSAAMSSGRVRLNEPRNDLASPVRAVATMTASRLLRMMDASVSVGELCREMASAARPRRHARLM